MPYRIAYRRLIPDGSPIHHMRKIFTDRGSAESAADNYNATASTWNTPVLHWAEPVPANTDIRKVDEDDSIAD